jgi:hypothetical protein
MEPFNPAIAPKRKGIRRPLGLVCIAVLILTFLLFGFWRLKLGGSVRAEVASIREKGLPVDWKDLEQWPVKIPDDQNAALIFNQALEATDDKSGDQVMRITLPIRNAAITNRGEIAAVVRAHSDAIRIIEDITNAASSRYPVDYAEGPNATLPHLTKLKTFAQLFACDALLHADQKDSKGAVGDIEASINLSRSLDAEPILISQLVSAAILGMTTESLERTLAYTPLSEPELSELSKDFSRAEATNRFWLGMVGERASGGEMLRLLNEDPRAFILMANKAAPPAEGEQTDVPPRFYHGYLVSLTGFWVRDRNFFLRAMDTNIVALAGGPPESFRYTNEFNGVETNARRGFYIMSSLLLPAFSKVVFRDAESRARLRTAIAAIAIERWRSTHGEKIPDSLAELVPDFLPAVPQDPFDGQPVRFKKRTKGYIVYSIGPNFQDDGGKERVPYGVKVSSEERKRYDVTFIVER